MKFCNWCNTNKKNSDFYKDKSTKDKLQRYCKECLKLYKRKWKIKNRKREQEKDKKYRQKTKERRKKYIQKLLKTNKEFKLRHILRDRFRKALKNKYKVGSAVKDLGCSIEYFRKYIELKFQPKMTWKNYGKKWHIDHIKPLASFNLTDEKQLKEALHYSNLQPLWKLDNLRKSNKISDFT